MEGEFKQCPNGHYYQEEHCPYCKMGGGRAENNTSLKTKVFVGGGNSQIPTEVRPGIGGGIKTTIVDGQEPIVDKTKSPGTPPSNRTVFGETEFEMEKPDGTVKKGVTPARTTRKLVGWLVTYSFDAMGVDYKIYEGRNIIGRDMDCNMTVNDGMMSGKHATLLFRGGQYALKDEMSSHGTFVNDENIGFETRILQDGDVIRMGKTVFMVRFSLFAKGIKTYDTQRTVSDSPNTPTSDTTTVVQTDSFSNKTTF